MSKQGLRVLTLTLALLTQTVPGAAQSFLLQNGHIHSVSGPTITNGFVLVQDGKISRIGGAEMKPELPSGAEAIDLKGGHVYPGLIALDTALGLTEIESVRATRDASEVGEYTPDVQSWAAVNPDSELIPVARAGGIAVFEASPRGSIVAGQSALLAADGWTSEQMLMFAPAALHLFWPSMELNLTPREKARDTSRLRSLDEQSRERRARLKALEDFFHEAKAYAKARQASTNSPAFNTVPAWEAMLPYVNGERPVVIHADEARQIRSAVNWASTNRIRIIIAGGRDAALAADLLARHEVPVIYETVFVQPVRDTDSYDLQFSTPELLRRAGVKVAFGFGPSGFAATAQRNLPYAAAQAIAFGLPEREALKALTLYPAEFMGATARLGTIEPGKEATLIVCNGSLFDIGSTVRRMWIAGKEVSLESRHTRLYERYRNRPKP